MSRIGKMPVTIPEKVDVKIDGKMVTVKGAKGELSYEFTDMVEINNDGKEIVVKPVNESKQARSLWGTTRTLINNMVVGVSEGFTKTLEFEGVGYKAAAKGDTLVLNLGYSHPIDYKLPEGITAKVTKNVIDISGSSKELVGFVAAKVRSFRPPEPYKGKGVRYQGEVILRKAGKSGGKK